MAKLYIFGTEQKGKTLSEFETHKLVNSIPEEEKLKTKEYELVRTKKGAIYKTNRRTRTKHSFKIRRLCALIAKQCGSPILYDEDNNIIITDNTLLAIADQVKSQEEFEYFYNKPNLYTTYQDYHFNVISLVKSQFALYLQMDTKTIKEYYKKDFTFPDWFRPLLKQKHFRTMNCSSQFVFSTRKYNDTSKWKAEDKFRNDMLKLKDPGKCYYSIARMLDVKKESAGQGYPIDLMTLVADIDGSHDGLHEIDERGICLKCLENANSKLDKVKQKVSTVPGLSIYKILFSGSKGWHVYMEYNGKREVQQNEMLRIIIALNSEEELVDTFMFEKDGVMCWDKHRIFKVVNTCCADTACLISEEIKRLPVDDKLLS